MPGFIALYHGVQYHLKEHRGRTPTNKELFNLQHFSLSSKIDHAFSLLKNRFKILAKKPITPYITLSGSSPHILCLVQLHSHS